MIGHTDGIGHSDKAVAVDVATGGHPDIVVGKCVEVSIEIGCALIEPRLHICGVGGIV